MSIIYCLWSAVLSPLSLSLPRTRAQIRRSDRIHPAQRRLIPKTSSEAAVAKVVVRALIIGWVKPHDTLRPAGRLSLSFSQRAQGHRKEWLPPCVASGTLSQPAVRTINLALRCVIGFTRWDQSDTVCRVSVCPSVCRLVPVLPTFRVVSPFIPSGLGRAIARLSPGSLRKKRLSKEIIWGILINYLGKGCVLHWWSLSIMVLVTWCVINIRGNIQYFGNRRELFDIIVAKLFGIKSVTWNAYFEYFILIQLYIPWKDSNRNLDKII